MNRAPNRSFKLEILSSPRCLFLPDYCCACNILFPSRALTTVFRAKEHTHMAELYLDTHGPLILHLRALTTGMI